jgi:hypothetical protein
MIFQLFHANTSFCLYRFPLRLVIKFPIDRFWAVLHDISALEATRSAARNGTVKENRQERSTPQRNPEGKSSFAISAPSLLLPKGGGAIRGIGEKFAANPVTGTGSMSVPIYTSPGRSGFGPQLSLSYDSGAGTGAITTRVRLMVALRIGRERNKSPYTRSRYCMGLRQLGECLRRVSI